MSQSLDAKTVSGPESAASQPPASGPRMSSPHKHPIVPFDYTRPCQNRLYCWLALPLFRFFDLVYFSRRILRGRERLPKTGPVILAINHPAVADAFLVGAYLNRRRLAYLMAEEELFFDRFPFRLIASLIRPLGAFPVDRRLSVDRRAITYAIDRLVEGELLSLAPEGGTERGWGLLPFRSGFAHLALRARERRIQAGMPADVQIVPVALMYRETARGLRTKKAMRFRAKAGVLVGHPFSLEPFLDPAKKNGQIADEIAEYTRNRVSELLRELQQAL
jgi:1-acyl-sn-glycerol-3-phosphate acyltransferase